MADRAHASYAGDQPYFFVSYGHADSDLVYPEMRWLQEAGFKLWYDDGIHVGSVWRKAIADGLIGHAVRRQPLHVPHRLLDGGWT
jgi:hypothetical protein